MTRFYLLSRDLAGCNYRRMEPYCRVELVAPLVCTKCDEELTLPHDAPGTRYSFSPKGEVGDLLTDGISIAVSERFASLYHGSDLSGLSLRTIPLNLFPFAGVFFYAIPKATCVLIDESASGIVIDKLSGCECCRVMSLHKIERLVIREETWNGEDVFCCGSLFSEIIVTEKFVRFVEMNSLMNFRFIDADSFSFDYRHPSMQRE